MAITEIRPAIREQGRESSGLLCKKSHQSFISINSLETTAPAEFQDDVSLSTIKAVANLTAKIQQRPSLEYVNHKKCVPLTSSGFITNFMVTNGTCCCSKCNNSTEPSKNWANIEIHTASHAVTPGKADSLVFTLFCDGSNKEKTTLRVAKVIDKGSDLCILQCHTCDVEQISKLESLLQVYRASSEKLHKKYEQVADKDKPVFIVSHPHGGPKNVSFGHLVMDETISDASPFLSYSNSTCVGSSGALVFIAGYNNWAIHIGTKEFNNKGLKVGVGRLASIHSQENFVGIERQIELEAGLDVCIEVKFLNPISYKVNNIYLQVMDIHGTDYTNEEVKRNLCYECDIPNYNDYDMVLKQNDRNYSLEDKSRVTNFFGYFNYHDFLLTLVLREGGRKSQTNNSRCREETQSTTAPSSKRKETKSTTAPTQSREETESTTAPPSNRKKIQSTTAPISLARGELRSCCVTEETKTLTSGCCVTEETKTLTSGCCVTEETKTLTSGCCLTEETKILTSECCLTEETKTLTSGCCVTEETKTLTSGCCLTEETKILTSECCVTEETKTLTSGCCVTEETKTLTSGCSVVFAKFRSRTAKAGEEYVEKFEEAAKECMKE